ncbi:MAG: isoprenyl transferase [Eubacteriales bacterium]
MSDLKIPEHIAVIMDGNGRWAKKRMMPRSYGHRRGFDVFVSTADACSDLGVKYLTVYAFSTENWSRPRDEVDALTGIIRDMVSEYIPRMLKKNIRMNVFGDISRFPADTRAALEKSVSASKDCGGLTVNVCLSYGGRDEIVRACRRVIASGNTEPTERDLSEAMYTSGMPDPDLIIRTGGEYRISNFLLWQCAYSELYFTPVLWPDFGKQELIKAIESFSERDRRYGNTKGE